MPGNLVQFFEIGSISLVVEQLSEEFSGRGKEDLKPFEASSIAQGCGQERFAHASGSGDQDMFPPLDEVTGSQLDDICLVQALSVGREVDLFECCALSEAGVVEQVLTSPVLSFFPFCMNESGKAFIGAGRFQGTACQGGLVSMPHAMESHLGEQVEGGRCCDHDK